MQVHRLHPDPLNRASRKRAASGLKRPPGMLTQLSFEIPALDHRLTPCNKCNITLLNPRSLRHAGSELVGAITRPAGRAAHDHASAGGALPCALSCWHPSIGASSPEQGPPPHTPPSSTPFVSGHCILVSQCPGS